MGILEPKHGSISPRSRRLGLPASRPLRPLRPLGPSLSLSRAAPPSLSRTAYDLPLTRDRSPPSASLARTTLTDPSVTRADLSFSPNGPYRPKPPLCSHLRYDGSTSSKPNSILSHDRHASLAPAASPSPPSQPVTIHPLVGSRFTMPQELTLPTNLVESLAQTLMVWDCDWSTSRIRNAIDLAWLCPACAVVSCAARRALVLRCAPTASWELGAATCMGLGGVCARVCWGGASALSRF
eukprot:2505588-Prymnesium_polylepis.3